MSFSTKKLTDNFLKISDSGIYAYLSLCSICLSELFPGEDDKHFNKKYIKEMCQDLKVNEKKESVMLILIEERNTRQSPEPYVTLLLQEPALIGKSILIVQHTVLFALQNGKYDARQRVLARRLSELLMVPFELIEMYEHSLVALLSQQVLSKTEDEEKEIQKRDRMKKIKRYTSIGLATLAGGTLIGLTGGLAAPFIGVGVGTILGGASTAILTSTAGVALIGSIFGVAGAGLTGYKMNKRVGQLEEFSFEPISKISMTDHQLHIAIAVIGWLKTDDTNVVKPWRCLALSREQYALRYETKYLVELGKALEYILSMAVSFATQEALKYTILSGIITAIAWPAALLSISSVIDNPWSVCCRRSSEVGKHLAHVLLSRQQGNRPVTLIGYSLGARVIFYCLRELAELGNAQGIIQDAIMLGAPVTNKKNHWDKCSKVVAGKIINGFCGSDWLLRFLYRTLSMSTGVAGLMAVDCDKVTNVDVSSIIKGHTEYSDKLADVIQLVGVKTRSTDAIDDDGVLKKSTSSYSQCQTTCNKLSRSKSLECLNIFHQ